MNKIGWTIVLVLLLVVYGYYYVVSGWYGELLYILQDAPILGAPHIILFLFLVGWNVKTIYTADW